MMYPYPITFRGDYSPFLIAEIGINHNGDMKIVKQLIDSAHDAGFDAVKFQKRTLNKVYTKEFLDSPRDSPWGKTQFDQKNGLELSIEDYREIDSYCKNLGILWSASAWDIDSIGFLNNFDLSFNKVASPMLGNTTLVHEIAKTKKYCFISTGMSTLDELDFVVNLFHKEGCKFELMHCVSTYPMKENCANLNVIHTLRNRYSCLVGYSGHESSLIKICVAATALGASSIERHITLDRTLYGSDQAASLEANSLRNFVDAVRRIPAALGNGIKSISDDEMKVREKLRFTS